jgi:hypothetical protein
LISLILSKDNPEACCGELLLFSLLLCKGLTVGKGVLLVSLLSSLCDRCLFYLLEELGEVVFAFNELVFAPIMEVVVTEGCERPE